MNEQEALAHVKDANRLPQQHRGFAQGFASLADQIMKTPQGGGRERAMQRLAAAFDAVVMMGQPQPARPLPARPAKPAPQPAKPAPAPPPRRPPPPAAQARPQPVRQPPQPQRPPRPAQQPQRPGRPVPPRGR